MTQTDRPRKARILRLVECINAPLDNAAGVGLRQMSHAFEVALRSTSALDVAVENVGDPQKSNVMTRSQE